MLSLPKIFLNTLQCLHQASNFRLCIGPPPYSPYLSSITNYYKQVLAQFNGEPFSFCQPLARWSVQKDAQNLPRFLNWLFKESYISMSVQLSPHPPSIFLNIFHLNLHPPFFTGHSLFLAISLSLHSLRSLIFHCFFSLYTVQLLHICTPLLLSSLLVFSISLLLSLHFFFSLWRANCWKGFQVARFNINIQNGHFTGFYTFQPLKARHDKGLWGVQGAEKRGV